MAARQVVDRNERRDAGSVVLRDLAQGVSATHLIVAASGLLEMPLLLGQRREPGLGVRLHEADGQAKREVLGDPLA